VTPLSSNTVFPLCPVRHTSLTRGGFEVDAAETALL
jgi:hypothetical protein